MFMPDITVQRPAPDPFRALTAFAGALLVLSLIWAVSSDPRLVDGSPVWMKPAKFALSFVLLFATMALVADRLSPAAREGWVLRGTAFAMAVAFAVEMAWMIRQAARGVGSHWNLETVLEAVMYSVMGVGAVTLVLGVGVTGWLVRRDREADLSPALREGVWLGFGLTFLLTLVVAGTMSSMSGHHVGVHPEGGATVPLLGWSLAVGDLRPPHFLSIHAMQALPLLALWLEGRGRGGDVRTIRLGTLAWTAATLATFGLGLAGLPILPLG